MLRRLSPRNENDHELPLTTSSSSSTQTTTRFSPLKQESFKLRYTTKSKRSTGLGSLKIPTIALSIATIGYYNRGIFRRSNVEESLRGRQHDLIVKELNMLLRQSDDLTYDSNHTNPLLFVNRRENLDLLIAKNDELRSQLERTKSVKDMYDSKIENLQVSMIELEREKESLEYELENELEISETMDAAEKTLKRESAIQAQIDRLESRIRRESHREVIERFGPGPHKVKFDIVPPGIISASGNTTLSFTVQLAPVDLMPHSIHLFLEQVYHQLWDGCSFTINEDHVLQVGPYHSSNMENVLQTFKDLDLDVVSFQEYSDDYPHEKYTLGYAGRPGGPDFYINMKDNTRIHGPNGEIHGRYNKGEPCFAKVISGFEVLDMLRGLPTDHASGVFKELVEIKSVQIIG